MSEKQRAAVREFTSNRVYAAIAAIYEKLPDRFTTSEVERRAKLRGPGSMYAAISVLERAFKCHRNVHGVWRKPETCTERP